MRTIICILLFAPLSSFAQEQVFAKKVDINFDKVVHIVLSSDIEYVSSGSSYIEATVVQEKQNIVRVSVLEEDFPDNTNVTIITKSGNIYTYNFSYKKEITKHIAVFYPDENIDEKIYNVVVNTFNVTHIIFPASIIYLRQGNEEIIRTTITSAKNIVSVAASEELLCESNLFCVDQEGHYYHINIIPGTSSSYLYNLTETTADKQLAVIELNENDLKELAEKVLDRSQEIFSLGIKKNKYEFSLNNILVHNNILFFVFQLKNNSNIHFDIDFIKCFLVDKKTTRNAIQQEYVIDYIYEKDFPQTIKAKSSNKFLLIFNKFTIPNNKIFKVEIYERNGGRNINFTIDNDIIMSASAI
jgi:conjugative transposon TraN protein